MSGPLALVTGATGFVGSHVVEALLGNGYRVRALARPTSRRENIAGMDCEVVLGDLLQPDTLHRAAMGVDLVFHVAADYRLWSRDPRSLYRTNIEGTANVLEAAHAARAHRIVYTSTVGVLGIPGNGSPGTEQTPVTLQDMVGHYKRSKFLAEERARKMAQEMALDMVIVYPSTPVGERDIKPTPTGRIIVDFLNGRMPAYVDTGLNLVDVRDVAAGHVLAVERGSAGGRYILGNQNVSLKQILEMLADIVGRPAPRARLPYWVAYGTAVLDTFFRGTLLGREPRAPLEGVRMASRRMYFDASLAVRELGLPQSPVREALRRAVAWFIANGYVARCSQPVAAH